MLLGFSCFGLRSLSLRHWRSISRYWWILRLNACELHSWWLLSHMLTALGGASSAITSAAPAAAFFFGGMIGFVLMPCATRQQLWLFCFWSTCNWWGTNNYFLNLVALRARLRIPTYLHDRGVLLLCQDRAYHESSLQERLKFMKFWYLHSIHLHKILQLWDRLAWFRRFIKSSFMCFTAALYYLPSNVKVPNAVASASIMFTVHTFVLSVWKSLSGDATGSLIELDTSRLLARSVSHWAWRLLPACSSLCFWSLWCPQRNIIMHESKCTVTERSQTPMPRILHVIGWMFCRYIVGR